ncbi:hypothetical protein NC651_024615 [Populus alba x Populus x berolinensis]|nr:hypothetical protein NC651_024615 [Populus alba x Populus x berolinensis]
MPIYFPGHNYYPLSSLCIREKPKDWTSCFQPNSANSSPRPGYLSSQSPEPPCAKCSAKSHPAASLFKKLRYMLWKV